MSFRNPVRIPFIDTDLLLPNELYYTKKESNYNSKGIILYKLGMTDDDTVGRPLWVDHSGYAEKLLNARTIGLSGVTATAQSFNGTKNITIPITEVPVSLLKGIIDVSNLPAGSLERMIHVKDKAARFSLTVNDIQKGDTVKQEDTGVMYYVIDTDNLGNDNGYEPYSSGAATTVPWAGVTNKPTVVLSGDATGSSDDNYGLALTLVNSGVTAGSYGQSTTAAISHNGTFKVPYITVDAKGRVTAASTKTITLPNTVPWTSITDRLVIELTGDATGKSTTEDYKFKVTLANSGVTAGSYGQSDGVGLSHGAFFNVPYITVDAKGRVTAASTKKVTLPSTIDWAKVTNKPTITLTGDITGSGSDPYNIETTLKNSGVTAGSYGQSADAAASHNGTFKVPYITVDAKGRVTAASTKTITLGSNKSILTATIGTSWSGSAAPYTQTITVSGVLATDAPHIEIVPGSNTFATLQSLYANAAKIYRITTAANSITVYANDKTTVNIPIQLTSYR